MENDRTAPSNVGTGDAYLFYIDAEHRVRTCCLKELTTIARNSSICEADIKLNSRFVSSNVHGEIVKYNGLYYYHDNSSTNGTFINGEYLHNSEKLVRLSSGDILRVVATDQFPEENVVMIFSDNMNIPQLSWRTFKPDASCSEFHVGRQGDNSPNRFVMSSPDVSRNQCVFNRDAKGWVVTNMSQTNPTLLNGRVITDAARLKTADVLQCGLEFIIFDGEYFHIQTKSVAGSSAYAEENGLRINIIKRDVNSGLFGGKRKTILKDINININHGEFVLILGGSGAGKTTFMNAVMAYEKADGKIIADGIDMYENYRQVKELVGFVPQQNLIRTKDNVYDTLADAARMRTKDKYAPEELDRKVTCTLKQFGLTAQKDSLVSSLSGGQIRRLSIAIEHIGDPRLFFLDEPDSGLDYATSRVLLETLRSIADEGKIVMLISHGPDRGIDPYDKVLVLAKSEHEGCGKLAFFGNPYEACDYFEVENLEKIMTKINCLDEGGEGLSDYFIKRFEKERQKYGV